MSSILLPSRLRQQPQQGAQLDRSNRFAANAQAIITATQDINHATGKQLVRGGTGYTRAQTAVGQSWPFRKNFYVETEILPAIGTQSFVEFWYGYPGVGVGTQGSSTTPTFVTGSNLNQFGIASIRASSFDGTGNTAGWGAVYKWDNGTIINSAEDTLIPGELTLLMAVRRQSGMELWRNGRLLRSISQTPTSYPAQSMICGSFIRDVFWTVNNDTILAGRVLTPVEPTSAEIRTFAENPWALWQTPRDRSAISAIFSAAVPANFTFTASSSDILSASDSVSIMSNLVANISDPLILSDSISPSYRPTASITDSLLVTDFGSSSINATTSISDSMSASDVSTTGATLTSSLSDVISAIDTNNFGSSSAVAYVSDMLSAIDSVSSIGNFVATTSDVSSVTDAYSGLSTRLASLLDSLAVVDQAYIAGSSYSAGSSDSIVITDICSSKVSSMTQSSDSMSAIDQLVSMLVNKADVSIPANQIPKNRWIVFEGGIRVVVMQGSERVVVYEGSNRLVEFK